MQLTVWSLPSLAAACISLAAYVRARPRDHIPGGHALRFLFLTLFMWSAAHTLGTFFTTEAAVLLASQLAYIGIALAPVAWFVFAVTYAKRVRKISRHALNTISIIPTITLILAVTNEYHGLVWANWAMVNVDGFTGLVTQQGFWVYVHAAYSYSLILVATAILGFSLTQYQQHYQTLLAAVCAPLVGVMANIFTLSSYNQYPWLDFTTLGFVFGVLILDFGILRRGLLDAAPVTRERIVEQLKDPVLVLDYDGKIKDANQSALVAWDSNNALLGTSIRTLIPSLPVVTLVDPRMNCEATIDGRAYEIAATPLDTSNTKTDVAIVFRDVTERRETLSELQNVKTELERIAHTDSLTGMYNRRFFMKRLGEEFERINRHGSTLSVLIFDLDHFKRVNDTHGHDLGDAVLIAIADVVNQIKRLTDISCRLGGEEFALLLPETDKIGAINLAQRLRRGIQEYPYQEKTGKRLAVTASIGVATVSPQTREPQGILKIADRALYRAKDGGRNMVCVDQELL